MDLFRSLRIRLALYNLSVILGLFMILTVGTYIFLANRFNHDSDFFRHKIAEDLIMGFIDDLPPHPMQRQINGEHEQFRPPPPPPPPNSLPPFLEGEGFRPEIGFLKIDEKNSLIGKSSRISFTGSQIERIIEQIKINAKAEGEIMEAEEGIEYKYLIADIPDSGEKYIILQNFQHESMLLKYLIMSLSIMGLICMLFSLLGSFFLANKALIPIQKAWQQQKDFLADVSHELRTPLAVIQTNVGVLEDCSFESIDSQRHWLKNIAEEVVNMTKLVTSLLFLARADSEQQKLVKAEFSFVEMVCAAKEAFDAFALEKSIILSLNRLENDIIFYGDEGKIRQVIFILLDNALRHTQAGGEVSISIRFSDSSIILIIEDTGEGIAVEHLGKVFDRFYQADNARAKGGSGLGLSIAKWIVESHEGSLTVESILGMGAKFTLKLSTLVH